MSPKEMLMELLGTLKHMTDSGEEIPDEMAGRIAQAIEKLSKDIQEGISYTEDVKEGEFPEEQPQVMRQKQARQPQGVELLWILSGGDETAFINYLRTMPVPEGNELLKDPSRLQETIEGLKEMMPQGFLENQEEEGIPHGPLQSSNVYGYRYDPSKKEMLVRFNNGSIYKYDNVPPSIANLYQSAMVPAKTDGNNEYGTWWKGKSPSQGATQFELLNKGPYPYERVA